MSQKVHTMYRFVRYQAPHAVSQLIVFTLGWIYELFQADQVRNACPRGGGCFLFKRPPGERSDGGLLVGFELPDFLPRQRPVVDPGVLERPLQGLGGRPPFTGRIESPRGHLSGPEIPWPGARVTSAGSILTVAMFFPRASAATLLPLTDTFLQASKVSIALRPCQGV